MSKYICNIIKTSKRAAGRILSWSAGALLCVFLTGCTKEDRELSVCLGEPLEATVAISDVSADNLQETGEGLLYVYVCGAVEKPGVVTLPAGSRYNDALEAAGGFREDADRVSVNLAALLSDGMQLYFPTKQESLERQKAQADKETGLVNINTAGEELLCTLPGIGQAKAKAIVAYRERNGAFDLPEQIMQVPGIKESAYTQLKDLITTK